MAKEEEELTSEQIREMLLEIFHEYQAKKKEKREVKVLTGCKTFGHVILGEQICNDPECLSCSDFHRLLAEEANSFLNISDDEFNK